VGGGGQARNRVRSLSDFGEREKYPHA
jgi:hypothetical protein